MRRRYGMVHQRAEEQRVHSGAMINNAPYPCCHQAGFSSNRAVPEQEQQDLRLNLNLLAILHIYGVKDCTQLAYKASSLARFV